MRKAVHMNIYSLLFILFCTFSSFAAEPVSNTIWNDLLSNYVNDEGKVDYTGIINDKEKLNTYLNILSEKMPAESWGKEAIMAYWINVYNAFTVKLIVDNYPLNSIMDLKFEGKSAWDYSFIKIENEVMTLNYVEHEILRKYYKDPRIHFAVNCASISCPRLLNTAFNAENLEEQLSKLTAEHINDSEHNKLSANSVKISQLFNWYKDDFTMNGSIIDFLNEYAKIKINQDAEISFIDYNWNLNKQE